jgi:carotenoid cleavage dioxygenase-like enzyme
MITQFGFCKKYLNNPLNVNIFSINVSSNQDQVPRRLLPICCTLVITSFTFRLIKIDVQTGDSVSWTEQNCQPGEPVFVPRHGAKGEDDGVVLSVVLDPNSDQSFLLVLDSKSFKEIARASVPHHIPFGIHGQYYGDT